MTETYIIVSDSTTSLVDAMEQLEKTADKMGINGWEPVGNANIDKEDRGDDYQDKYLYRAWLTMKRKLAIDDGSND